MTVKDCACFLQETFQSIFDQTYRNLEICIYDDGSIDESLNIIHRWIAKFREVGFGAELVPRPIETVSYVQLTE